jgi:phospholipid/cholesterol/gamma-HCH transport system substrate-binding protein
LPEGCRSLNDRAGALNWLGGDCSSRKMSDIQIQPSPIAITRVICVWIGALVIVMILVWLLTGGGGEIFEPKSYLHSYMPDASGLIVTAAVQLNGIQIGKISDVKLSGLSDPKKVVWVEMKVKSRYLPAIPVDSTISITADDLLGDKYLNILIGQRSETVKPGAELRSVLPIGDQFNSADLVAAMKEMLDRVDTSLRQIEDARTPIGRFVQTEDLYNQIRGYIITIQESIRKFAHPQSQLGQMLFTAELYEQMRAPIVGIDKTLADLQAGEGAYGHMLASSDQYDRARKQLADLRDSLADVNAGKGSVGKLMQTNELYERIQRLLKSLAEMVEAVNHGENRLGVYMADSQLFESLTGSTGDLQHTLDDFRKNPRKYLRLKVF